MIREIRKRRPGDRIRLDVYHWDGGRDTVTVVLGSRPSDSRRR
jgi:putative serine protease PepD